MVNDGTKKHKDVFASLGIILAIAGVSCMGIVKGLIGANLRILSTVVVVLSVILLIKGQEFGYIAIPTAEVGLIFMYSFVTLMMSLFSGIPIMQNGYGFIYQAAGLVQIWLLWNINIENDVDYYVDVGFWLCGIFCLITLSLLLSTESLFVNSFTSKEGEYLFNRSTIGAISFRAFVMAIAYKPEAFIKKRIRVFFILISLVVIVASTRRGVYLATIVCVLLYFRNNRKDMSYVDTDRILKSAIIAGWVLIVCFLLYGKSVYVQETLNRAWKSLVGGVQTFIGVDDSDMAASMRVSSAKRVINEFLNHSTVKQTFVGRGYMTTWVDMPCVQAFWDLGLIGGIAFGKDSIQSNLWTIKHIY